MSYAPSSVYFDSGDGTIIGRFNEVDVDNMFEFSENTDDMTGAWDFPHKIWVGDGYRYGKVLKTRAYIAVDEDAMGQPIVEKWDIKQHRVYPRAS